MQHPTIRRVLLGVAITGGAWLCLTALDGAAHAGDSKPAAVVQQPGGLLDGLPEQAADRAREVVDQVAADKPAPPKAEPTPTPEPTRTETPAPPADEPSEEPEPPASAPPADPIVDVPPAEVPPVVAVPPVVVEPAPATDPIVITLPATDPAPPTRPVVQPAPVLPVVLPVALPPVLIAPVPATHPPASIVAQMVAELVAASPDPAADCVDRPDDAVNINRDAIRRLIANLTEPAASPRVKPAPGCPGTPGNPLDHHGDCASTTATNSGHNGANAAIADLADSNTAPALDRLQHARPRSHIPAGRHTAIEPGPA